MSQNEISKLLSTSRNTIRKIKAVTDSIRLSWEDASKMTNEEFVHTIFPKNKNDNEELQPRPDCEMMYKELQKPGVTRTLLWEEYAREVKAAGKIPLQYSQFCNYFNHYLEINKATMHFEHKIAERIEVDWCGTTIPIAVSYTHLNRRIRCLVPSPKRGLPKRSAWILQRSITSRSCRVLRKNMRSRSRA